MGNVNNPMTLPMLHYILRYQFLFAAPGVGVEDTRKSEDRLSESFPSGILIKLITDDKLFEEGRPWGTTAIEPP